MRATVVSDGAAVYEKPDFDSKVIDFVPYNTKVIVSKRAFAGVEGLGLFHRVRVRGKLGYIPDTDIRVAESAREKVPEKVLERTRSKAWEPEEQEVLGQAPIYMTRYLGGAVARVNFTEKFSGRKLSDQITMYGLRMTGPGALFDGPPLDVNLWFSMEKPGYYDIFSTNFSGFLLFGDVMAMMPLISHDKFVVNYGLGLMWTFTKFRLQIRGENTDSLEVRVGVNAGLGAAYRIAKKFLLRGDVKYYYEKTGYPGFLLSLQTEY